MDVTRAEFDALVHRVDLLDGTSTPVPVPTKGLTLSVPVVKVTKSKYAIVAKATPHETFQATYFQIAVRGPGANDLALHPGQKFTVGKPVTLNASGTGIAGTYTAYLAYSIDGTTWVDGPKATFTVAPQDSVPPVTRPPAGGGKLPLIGKSGLEFNSLVFRSTREETLEFGRRRGVPMDGLLYFTPRQSWQDLRYHPDGQQQMLDEGMIVVTSMPHAPESEGEVMNERGANDGYRDEQRALGKWMADNGFNSSTHALRIDWEANGDWYHWSANRPGGWQALREAIKNCVINLRAGGCTKNPFDLCYNKGPNQSGAAYEFFPGAEYIDIVGIDQYDMWAPSFNDEDWEREMAKGPSARTNAAFAAEHGIQWSWDEGGNTHGDSNQGGDNPTYWRLRRAEIQRNIANIAWDNTYDHEGAPASLAHDFEHNPQSWPVYKRLWTPQ